MRHIVRELEDSPTHTVDAERILDELEVTFTGGEARRQFETVVDWGRYAELFTYDDSAAKSGLMRNIAPVCPRRKSADDARLG